MKKNQKIYKTQYSSRTYSNRVHDGQLLGLTPKEKVYVYERGDTLLYSHNNQPPEGSGYTIFKVQAVEQAQSYRSQVTLPAAWIKEHAINATHVEVEYTNDGLYIGACDE